MNDAGLIRGATRAALLRALEPWAAKIDHDITLVFDGPPPLEGFRKPVSSDRINVLFSAPHTADDIIVRLIHDAKHPERLRIVSSDKAIAYEARRRRSRDVACAEFMDELAPQPGIEAECTPPLPEKPQSGLSKEETDGWMSTFGLDEDDEPFDGYNDMLGN